MPTGTPLRKHKCSDLRGRTLTPTVKAKKQYKNHGFLMTENTARGLLFSLGFTMYLPLARMVQMYLFLAIALLSMLPLGVFT